MQKPPVPNETPLDESECRFFFGAIGHDRCLTKIMATPGKLTRNKESLARMMDHGVCMMRLNMSHGTHESHAETIQMIREVAESKNRLCAILMDTKGPEIRTGLLENHTEVLIEEGQVFIFTTDVSVIGNSSTVSVTYPKLPETVHEGDTILVDDGLLCFFVFLVDEEKVYTRALNSGTLGEKKGVNLPGLDIDIPPVTNKDIDDIRFGIEQSVDFLGMSFIQNASAVQQIKDLLGKSRIQVFSKIESRGGLNNLEAIVTLSDGATVARGDLGIEIPLEQIFSVQKRVIKLCNSFGKPVITATQIFHSMLDNSVPTSAEVTDCTNAIFDGTDCLSLSAETAQGKYPFEVLSIASKVCAEAESSLDYADVLNKLRAIHRSRHMESHNIYAESIAVSAVTLSHELSAPVIITISSTGFTPLMVAKYRPRAAIICATSDPISANQLLPSRGVFPILFKTDANFDKILATSISLTRKYGFCSSGDTCVVVVGRTGRSHATPYSVHLYTVP